MPLVAKEHDPLNAGDPETQAQLETLARKTSNPDQEPEVLGLHLRLRGKRNPPSQAQRCYDNLFTGILLD